MSERSVRPEVSGLFQAAENARLAGRREDERRALAAIVAADPANARALNALGSRALAEGNAKEARAYLQRAADADPSAPAIWLNLAGACRLGGDDGGEIAALERALAADPYMVLALLHKAQWHERQGDLRRAARVYGDLIKCGPPASGMPPQLAAAIAHGREVIAADLQGLRSSMAAAISDLRAERTPGERDHFDRCLNALLGDRVYVSQPTQMHFPYLSAIEFFDRASFPWIETLEAESAAIRDECLAVISEDSGFMPYVAFAPGQPVNQWAELNHSPAWSAFFLWKDGVAIEENLARCPRTAAALRAIPRSDVPGRAPTAFFSLLRPRTHIPPHTGVTNTRGTAHLALEVPEGCHFRVGAQTRAWRTGEAWVFDDTIEHEAWNRSDQPRAILIFDVWNPLLHERDRALVRATSAGFDRYYGSLPWQAM